MVRRLNGCNFGARNFGAKPQLRAERTFCKSRLALRAGVKTKMRCRLVDSVMMHCPPVGIPRGARSLADEVVELDARNHMGRVQEDVKQLP